MSVTVRLQWIDAQNAYTDAVMSGVFPWASTRGGGGYDPRVASRQSSMFAAALQKANTSPHPILLITRRGEGHGVSFSFSQRVGNTRLRSLAFCAEELGWRPWGSEEPMK